MYIFSAVLMVFYATNSVTAGAHRLWTHKSYKVSTKLTLINIERILILRLISGYDYST